MGTKTFTNWEFAARFVEMLSDGARNPPSTRIKQAVSEIKKMEPRRSILAGEGAIYCWRDPPALEKVDSSSGAIGSAVNHAIEDLCRSLSMPPMRVNLVRVMSSNE